MIGILGGLANLWLSQSYKFSEVSLVTPLKYLALVFAIIFGYFIWNEVPSNKTIMGSLMVVLSSLIIFIVSNLLTFIIAKASDTLNDGLLPVISIIIIYSFSIDMNHLQRFPFQI